MLVYKGGDYVDFVLSMVHGYTYVLVFTYYAFAEYFDMCPK